MHPSYAGGALLAVDGELPGAELIAELGRAHEPILATDGAGPRLAAAGLVPRYVIGDMDSIGEECNRLAALGAEIIRLDSQEENDLEKALLWLVEQGAESVTVIGASGGMADHALNNFSVLARFGRRLRIAVRDAASTGYLVPDAIRIDTAPDERISLIPLPSAILTTTGLAWELRDEELLFGVREGASNRATGETVEIVAREGIVLVMHYPA